MQYHDIHDRESKYKSILEKIEKGSEISLENKKTILEFNKFEGAVGKKFGTRQKTMIILRRFSLWFGKVSFEKVTREQMQKVFEDKVNKLKTRTGKTICPATVMDYRKAIKKLYRWLLGDNEVYPRAVSWLKVKIIKCKVTSSDMITEDELKQMIDTAEHPRDKAFIACLFNSQARIAEFLNLRVSNVEFDADGAFLSIPQKKGQEDVSYRRVFIDFAVPYLAAWIQMHPHKRDKTSFLWMNYGPRAHGDIMSYSAARMLLLRIGKRAGINKPLKPHNFRHSGNTYLAGLGINPQVLATRNGHSSLGMAMVYTHLGAGQDKDAILRAKGLKKEEKSTNLIIKRCAKCKSDNSPTATRCDTCGWDLSVTEKIWTNELQKKVTIQDEKIKNMERMLNAVVDGRVLVQEA